MLMQTNYVTLALNQLIVSLTNRQTDAATLGETVFRRFARGH
jgi:hypothetical protein